MFSDAEEEKIIQLLELSSADELATLLDVICYIFEQSGYHALKVQGNQFEKNLGSMELLTEQKLEAFKDVWSESGQEFINKLKERSLGGPTVLADIAWKLNIQLSQSSLSKLRTPSALFEFKLIHTAGASFVGGGGSSSNNYDSISSNNINNTNENGWYGQDDWTSAGQPSDEASSSSAASILSATQSSSENLLVEFSHDDLFKFLQDLEKIQNQLDALSF